MEDRIIRIDQHRATKHTLGVILIQLEIFRLLPVGPIILLEETSSRETHNSRGVVVDITGFHNIIKSFTPKCRAVIRKVQSIIQLVVGELREILFAHLFDMSGEVSGCEKTRMHGCGLVAWRARIVETSVIDSTGVPLIEISQAPRK